MDMNSTLEFSPVNWAPVPFMHFCKLLEGQSCSELGSNRASEHTREQDTASNLLFLENTIGTRKLFSYVDESGVPAPLEVLWLKWRIFVGLCERVLVLHREHQAPFLAISPEAINVWMSPDVDSIFPFLWSFSIGLDKQFSPSLHNNSAIPESLSSRILLPAISGKSVFQPPEIQDWSLGLKQDLTVVILSLEQIGRGKVNSNEIEAQVKLYLPSENSSWANISQKDVFEVMLSQEGKEEDPLIHIWASRVEAPEQGLVLKGKTKPMPVAQWEKWRRSGKKVFPHSSVQVHGSFHVPSDFHSMGVLLLSLLIGPNSANFTRLELILPKIVKKLQQIESNKWEKDWNQCIKTFKAWCSQEGDLFLRPEAKNETVEIPSRALSIPLGLWDRMILLGFRLIARVPIFGFCENRDAYDPLKPQVVMERVVKESREIGMQLTKELFGFSRRNWEIRRICGMIRKEIHDDCEPINGL